jgi:hypothetical protein
MQMHMSPGVQAQLNYRLQVLIPEALDLELRKAAERSRVSKGEWVRGVLEQAVQAARMDDPLARLEALGAPTGDIDQMLAEIDAGRK